MQAGQQFFRKLGGVEYQGVFDGTHFCYGSAKHATPSAAAMAIANAHYADTKPHHINGWNVLYIKTAQGRNVYLKELRADTPTRPRAEPKPKAERKPKAAEEPEDAPPPHCPRLTRAQEDAMLALLGLTRDIIDVAADKCKIVCAAFRKMAIRYHPDKVGAAGEEQMKIISAAYTTLCDIYAN